MRCPFPSVPGSQLTVFDAVALPARRNIAASWGPHGGRPLYLLVVKQLKTKKRTNGTQNPGRSARRSLQMDRPHQYDAGRLPGDHQLVDHPDLAPGDISRPWD